MQKSSKILIAGYRGLVGSAFVRKLKEHRFGNLILRSRSELDLANHLAFPDFIYFTCLWNTIS